MLRGEDLIGHGVADLQKAQSGHVFASDNGLNGAACQQRIGKNSAVTQLLALTTAQANVLCGRIPDPG